MIEETAGQYIRRTRRAAGLSQRKLAAIVGVSGIFVCKIENDLKRVPDKRIEPLARALPGADADRIRELNRDPVEGWRADALAQLAAAKGDKFVADRGLSDALRSVLRELKSAREEIERRDRADVAESNGLDPGPYGRACYECDYRWCAGKQSTLCTACLEKRGSQR